MKNRNPITNPGLELSIKECLLTFLSFPFSCSTGLSYADSSLLDDSSLLEVVKSIVFFCLATTPEPELERSFFSRCSLALIER
jgi:hypothetical protein